MRGLEREKYELATGIILPPTVTMTHSKAPVRAINTGGRMT